MAKISGQHPIEIHDPNATPVTTAKDATAVSLGQEEEVFATLHLMWITVNSDLLPNGVMVVGTLFGLFSGCWGVPPRKLQCLERALSILEFFQAGRTARAICKLSLSALTFTELSKLCSSALSAVLVGVTEGTCLPLIVIIHHPSMMDATKRQESPPPPRDRQQKGKKRSQLGEPTVNKVKSTIKYYERLPLTSIDRNSATDVVISGELSDSKTLKTLSGMVFAGGKRGQSR